MKTLKATLAALIAVVAFSGCGSNNSNNGPLVNTPYGPGVCNGCGTGSAPLALAVGTSGYGEQLGLQFTLTSNGAGGMSGQVFAQGILDVQAYSQLCGLAPGRYTVSTQQVGTLQGSATVTNLMLVAQGPTSVQILVPQIQINYGISTVGRDGTTYTSTMFVDAYVNSYNCPIRFAPRN